MKCFVISGLMDFFDYSLSYTANPIEMSYLQEHLLPVTANTLSAVSEYQGL